MLVFGRLENENVLESVLYNSLLSVEYIGEKL